MSEHIEPVRDWAALRTLLRVVVKGCQVCGGEHGGTLVEQDARTVPVFEATRLSVDWVAAWVLSPAPPCVKAGAAAVGRTQKRTDYVITPLAVDQGRVFRIVNDADGAASPARVRKPERIE